MFNREYKRIDKLNNEHGPLDDNNVTPQIFIYIIIMIIFFILACICTYDGITHLVAPEWYAIKEVISLFK